jgi:glutamyl-tRNA reductase
MIGKHQLAILARDASGKLLSQVVVAAHHKGEELQEVMPIARNMLRIKGCSRVEIYPFENASAQYKDAPLAVLHASDLYWGSPVA